MSSINRLAAINEGISSINSSNCMRKVKNGGREFCAILSDFYKTPNLQILVKAAISNMEMLSRIPSIQGVFTEALVHLGTLKLLHNVTMVFGSFPLFFKINSDKTVSLQLPQKEAGGGLDVAKLMYSLGGFCGLFRYLHKMHVVHFDRLAMLGSTFGNLRTFSINGQQLFVKNTIFLAGLCESPQETFFLIASSVELYRWLKGATSENSKKYFEFEFLLKVTASFARVVCISCVRHFKGHWFLIILDFAGQNATLIAFIVRRKKERDKWNVATQ